MICLDTNIWIKERMLSSQAGKALIGYARAKGLKIFRPAVVAAELRRNVSKRVAEIDTEILALVHERRQLLGEPWDSYTALTATTEDVVHRAKYEFDDLIVDATENRQAKLLAADRVIDGRLPNLPKNQQFKDSLLWEELLLMETESVVFVTSDKNFYERQDLNKGLASLLLAEIGDAKRIDIFPDISSLLAKNNWVDTIANDKSYGRIAQNLLFWLGDMASRELESKYGVHFQQMSPAESNYRLIKSAETVSMQLLGWCAPFVVQPDGGLLQLKLDVYGEAIISEKKIVPESIILKEWRLHQGGYIEGGLSSE